MGDGSAENSCVDNKGSENKGSENKGSENKGSENRPKISQKNFENFGPSEWLPDMDSNHDKQIQRLLCYHYTIGQPEPKW